MKKRLYILTFLAVALVILVVGYFGLDLSQKYMEKKYVQLQIEVNKRQAQRMALFLSEELKTGSSEQKVVDRLQNSILGTETDKGYICMFEKKNAELICHPNIKMVGMLIPQTMEFDDLKENKTRKTQDIIKSGIPQQGLFHTEHSTEIVYMSPVKGTTWMLAVHENINEIRDEVKNQKEIFFYGFLFLSFIIAILATIMARIVGRSYEKTIEEKNEILNNRNEELKTLNTDLQQQKEEISAQKDEIENQKFILTESHDKIKHQNEQITSSIKYASRIQHALLPPEKILKEYFNEYFIFFRPRDIVSGDFYWLRKIKNSIIFVAADCTGHGVPGAFMSMLGISYLNEIVTEDFYNFEKMSAGQILNDLRLKIKTSLRQDEEKTGTKDGMDLALIILDTETNKLQYAGAYHPLIIVRNNKMVEVEADRMPAGVYLEKDEGFSNNRIDLVQGDTLYMFSDGYPDQFGGEKNRKYLNKRFKTLLHENSIYPLEIQKENIEKEFDVWKSNNDQVDDVIVVGIKI
jgi:serine phosphatase RsbU (regulator of sigma subunit)